MLFKPFRYPTSLLYEECQVLTVRQLFVLQTVMRKHLSLPYNPSSQEKRQRHRVCPTQRCRTALAKRHFYGIGGHIYNKINKICHIYAATRRECKRKVVDWLKTQNYEDIDNLLKI
ncbi:hypothetical protein PYW07_007766 [Mythimna separata]|uniref:Uncharacterized protein n=1 Tax=Mythimna separata TaxID=271217 RepID=A0AAD7YRG4_MYTSE|nr:hypothetical protein PYW07_008856 [Mythimna separata]KAJ8723786.1 hypothetical protein PYW07_007766 [Mythimna separata]